MTSTILSRSLALAASAGTVTALSLVPSAAHAAVSAHYLASGEANARYVGPTIGGSCDLKSGAATPTSPTTTFSHGTKHASLNLDAVFVSSDNLSDAARVKGHVTGTLTVKRSHGDLKAFDLQTGGALTTTHTMSGSACQSSGELTASTDTMFTEHQRGTITIVRTASKANDLTEFLLLDLTTDKIIQLEVVQGITTTTETSTAVLKPGHYEIEAESGLYTGSAAVLKTPRLVNKVTMSNDLTVSFKPLKKKHH